MTKVAVASGSFIVGACVGSLALALIQTSTRVQASQETVVAGAQVADASFGAREPEVFPLAVRLDGSTLSNPIQPLDGIDCEKCIIDAGMLTYAGGAFRFNECIFSRPKIPIQLKDAALNTFVMLQYLGIIAPKPPSPAPPKPPNKEHTVIASIKPNTPINWASLEGLK